MVAKKPAEKPKSSEKRKVPEKTKPDEKKRGALDWSKAKLKGENKAATPKTTKEVAKKDSKLGLKEKEEQAKLEVTKDEDPVKANPTKVKVDADKKAESDKPKVRLSLCFH